MVLLSQQSPEPFFMGIQTQSQLEEEFQGLVV